MRNACFSDMENRSGLWGLSALLVILVFAAFGAAVSFGFVNYDDGQYVYANEHIAGGLTFDGLKWALTTPHGANWHPLTSLSHMLDCQLFGLDAAGHHMSNLLLHAAVVVCLFAALRRMTGTLWRSALVAAVFALHPLRVESVVWISERKDVLSGLFFALTLRSYAVYAKQPFTFRRYIPVVLFFVLGLLSKPMLVTMPFVLLLFDFWPLHRTNGKRVLLEKLPLLFFVAVFCGVTMWAQGQAVATTEALPFSWRLGNAALSYFIYVKQLFLPIGLTVFYPAHTGSLPVIRVAASVLFIVLITVPVIWQVKVRPYLLVGWFFYLGTLVPVIGIIQVGSQAHADRYTYLPHIGLLIMVVWLAAEAVRAYRAKVVAAMLSVVVLTGLAICSQVQTSCWTDSISLWTHTLECTENNHIAHGNLGAALLVEGQSASAAEHLEKAIQAEPGKAELHNNLAVAYAETGRFQEATASMRTAILLAKDSMPPETVAAMLLRLKEYQAQAAVNSEQKR